MLFSAINTSRVLLNNLRSLCPILDYFVCLSARKRGAKGYVGPEFFFFDSV